MFLRGATADYPRSWDPTPHARHTDLADVHDVGSGTPPSRRESGRTLQQHQGRRPVLLSHRQLRPGRWHVLPVLQSHRQLRPGRQHVLSVLLRHRQLRPGSRHRTGAAPHCRRCSARAPRHRVAAVHARSTGRTGLCCRLEGVGSRLLLSPHRHFQPQQPRQP